MRNPVSPSVSPSVKLRKTDGALRSFFIFGSFLIGAAFWAPGFFIFAGCTHSSQRAPAAVSSPFLSESPLRSTSSVSTGSFELEIGERVLLQKLTLRADGLAIYSFIFSRSSDLEDSGPEFYTDPSQCELRTLLDPSRFGDLSRWTLRPQKTLADLRSDALRFEDIESGISYELRCRKAMEGNSIPIIPSPQVLEVITRGKWILTDPLQNR